jgi:hypothetical protein
MPLETAGHQATEGDPLSVFGAKKKTTSNTLGRILLTTEN